MNTGNICKVALRITLLATCAIAANFARADDQSGLGIRWQCTQQNKSDYSYVLCSPRAVQDGAANDANSAPSGFAGDDSKPLRIGISLGRGSASGTGDDGKSSTPDVVSLPLPRQYSDSGALSQLIHSVFCDQIPHCSVSYSKQDN